MNLNEITERIIAGGRITRDEALTLAAWEDLDALCDAADQIRRTMAGDKVDACSIANARSGLCSEDCRWCAQASRHHTGCKTYNVIDSEEVMQAARENERAGIRRFSLVTSGRSVSERDMPAFLEMYRRLNAETSLYLCASMGLLSEEQMHELRNAGVRRYHCNLETSAEFFPSLCTTHTPEEKKQTIRAARKAGLQVCSGGIIGMGETMAQRVDLALELRELDVDSVPINILQPIKGTPLEDQPLISEEEIIRTVAVFRFILPDKALRFAGGRQRLSRKSTARILRGGMNGVLMGDMLTSIGNKVEEDKRLFKECGLEY